MAIATSTNYYSNAIVGQPMAGADINIMTRSSDQRFALGLGFQRSDGNIYRYVQFGAAVAAGDLVGAIATNNNLASTNAIVVAPATAQAIAGDVIKAGAVGSRYVEIILTTVANNQFAGGTLAITKDTGKGYSYRIRGNTATNTPTTGNFRCELYEPIKVALDNTSDIAISPSKYANLSPTAGTLGSTMNCVGVAQAAASDNDYGWICTKGITAALASAADSFFGGVAIESAATGCYAQGNTLTCLAFRRIGTIRVPSAAALQMGIIDLQLE